MAPEWWADAQIAAEENHDPDLYNGREWGDLTSDEQEGAIHDQIYGAADAARAAAKEGA